MNRLAARRGCDIDDEVAMSRLAARVAARVIPGMLIALSGPLAAGKTTFARGFLHALGHRGRVKSPTFTLVESYPLPYPPPGMTVHHFDLYRLADPRELYFLGFDDYVQPGTLCLIEWPERGGQELPPFDVILTLEPLPASRRRITAEAQSPAGEAVLSAFHHEAPNEDSEGALEEP